MARTTKPLTNTEVKNSKPKDKVYILSDGGGLQLRVNPNGSKLWVFNYYRPYTKKRTCLSIGSYPDTSLAGARKEAASFKSLLANKTDPKTQRSETERLTEAAISNTFQKVALEWLKVKKTEVSEDHAKDIWRSIELHLLPELGEAPIHKLDAPMVIRVLKPISKRSLETVKRLCQRINEIMVYAVNIGMIHHNPLGGVSKAFASPVKKHMATISPDQLPAFMKALSTANIKFTTRCLIEWQLRTMVRPGEAAGTRWSEINFEKALWVIPPERMKKKKTHTVPLTPQALALLEIIKPFSHGSEFVFTGDRNRHKPANSSTANVAIKRMGFQGQLVAHGLRALASTSLNEQGFDPDLIEACLAHVDKNEVRATYNRAEYIERRRTVMAWWSDHIDKAATGNMSMATSHKTLRLITN